MDCNSSEETPDESCPACKEKGLAQALRIYRISFEESLFLCENPQCVYPFGFKPLSNIIFPIDAKDYPDRDSCRRRKFIELRETSAIAPCLKLPRTDEQTVKPDLAPKCNGDNLLGTQSGQPGISPASQTNCNTASESLEQLMGLQMEAHGSSSEVFAAQTQFLTDSELHASASQLLHQGHASLPEPLWLQWRNMYSLCWLDCILSALVHLKTLQMIVTALLSENLPVIQRLLTKYNEATALVDACQRDELLSEIPLDVLSKAESLLNENRNIIFVQLQPLLKCQLGEQESPVFAFPLLLQKDPQIEKLFLHSFSWKLECSECGHHVSDRCQKTLTTFTNIIPQWHPLNAVHIAPCNNCNHTSQRRKMILEKVSSVFMIHFVEGLPHNDLTTYSFQFHDDSYQITTVIQYQEPEHFVTWVLNSDGTWLVCDDLKGPYCSRRKQFEVPPSEVHIAIWERKPTSVTNEQNLQLENEATLHKAQPNSPVKCVDDKDIDNAAFICHKENILNVPTNETQNVVSNNENNLLWGLEHMAEDDVVTLTLVSVPLDSEGKPLEYSHLRENNLIAETDTSQQQNPTGSEVSPAICKEDTAENRFTLLEKTQTNDVDTRPIIPADSLNSSSCSQDTLLIQEAEVEKSPVAVENGNNLDSPQTQNKTNTIDSRNNVQKISNFVNSTGANSQISALSPPNKLSAKSPKDGANTFVGSWVKGLLGRYNTFMPKSALTCNKIESFKKSLQKESESISLIKGANQFSGFKPKHSKNQIQKVSEQALHLSHRMPPSSSQASSLCTNLASKRHTISENEETRNKSSSSVTLGTPIPPTFSHSENNNFTSVEPGSESNVNEAHQLRLKLLQQLKAKKEKLASLDKLTKVQVRGRNSPKTNMKKVQARSQKKNESLQSLINELQHHIDVEGDRIANSPSTPVSQCSSSSYDDILLELLSPATTVSSLELPQGEEECRYLEMGGSNADSAVHNEKSISVENPQTNHNYYIPVTDDAYDAHIDLFANTSSAVKFSFESPIKPDLDDLFSASVLNSVMADADILHNFDESLLSL